MLIHEIAISFADGRRAHRTIETEDLMRASVSVFSGLLAECADGLRRPISDSGVELHWLPADDGCGVAHLTADGLPMITCLLLSGSDQEAESDLLAKYQEMVSSQPRSGSADLLTVTERPVTALIVVGGPPVLLARAADLAPCLAAAFFEGACWPSRLRG